MNEKEQIEKLIKDYPKHFSKMVQNRENLWAWVTENTLLTLGSIPAHIYSAIRQESNQCINHNTKIFNSIHNGFRFCGPANRCKCAKESVSKKVTETKAKRTIEQIETENTKRESTNLRKYGVVNSAQTTYAKSQHSEVYKSIDKVASISNKIKATKLKKYGNSNYNNREQCANTNLMKYGVVNTWVLTLYNENP